MSGDRLARWSPITGILFAAFFVIAATLYATQPDAGSSDAKILAYYADHGNQVKVEIAYFLATLGAVLFLWFVGSLAARLREVEGEPGWLSRTVLVSGGAFTVVMLLGFTFGVMVANTSDHTSRFHADPDTARLLTDVIYPLTFETALPLAAPLVLAASIGSLRTALLPRWLGWTGLVVALGCVLGFLGATMALFLAWVVIVAVLLVRRASARRLDPMPAAPAAERT